MYLCCTLALFCLSIGDAQHLLTSGTLLSDVVNQKICDGVAVKHGNVCCSLASLLSIIIFCSCLITNASIVSSITLSSVGTVSYPTTEPDLVIHKDGNIIYVQNCSSGTDVYATTTAYMAFNYAFTLLANGGSITVKPGIYVGTSWNSGLTLGRMTAFTMRNCTDVTVLFEEGAILTLADHSNVNVFVIFHSSNCLILNIQIDGNSVKDGVYGNQGGIYGASSGIEIWDSSNCVIAGAKITNCQRDGFVVGSDDPNSNIYAPSGIKDSVISWCGSNGVTLEGNGNFAQNVTVTACSDVGITSWEGVNCWMANNYVYDMNWSYGSGGSSHYAYAVEYGANYTLIQNNVAQNCDGAGIVIGTGAVNCYYNTVKNNQIINCKTGILTYMTHNNVITQNTIANWGNWWGAGIMLNGQNNNQTVTFNSLMNSGTSTSLGYAIYATGASDCTIGHNTINIPLASRVSAIFLTGGASRTLITGNNVQAYCGIDINDASCFSNTLSQNILSNCTVTISNRGTNTIIS
jgi:parallel beta-helix repeat protein